MQHPGALHASVARAAGPRSVAYAPRTAQRRVQTRAALTEESSWLQIHNDATELVGGTPMVSSPAIMCSLMVHLLQLSVIYWS